MLGYLLFSLVMLSALLGFSVVAQQTATVPQPTGLYCPEEPGPVVDPSGVYVCVGRIKVVNATFASFYLEQVEDRIVFRAVCLVYGGCKFNITVYYINSSGGLVLVGWFTERIGAGESISKTVTGVMGRGVVRVEVNDVLLGYYSPLSINIDPRVPATLRTLASLHPLLTVVAGLLVVAVPLGWLLQREFGLAGLALASMSIPVYILAYALTGEVPVAVLISTLSALIGLILLAAHGLT